MDVGLALYRRSDEIVALEANPQIIEAMTGPLREMGGRIYRARGVTVLNHFARGYFAAPGRTFDLIQVPPGASGLGSSATHESYLYTVESFAAMLARLSDHGVLCVTRKAAYDQPQAVLRLFDTLIAALRRRGLEPAPRLAMVRNLYTVSVMASRAPLSEQETARLREFLNARRFDICYLPDLEESTDRINHYTKLPTPCFHNGARALLGPGRRRFLEESPFDVEAVTDDRPYFFHFLPLSRAGKLKAQRGERYREFLEPGYLMLLAALAQSVVLAALLILLPLLPGSGGLKSAPRKSATFGYFILLGAGFMLLEMGFLQKLILYLAHPIYSAAVVISSFLVFAGVGSQVSRLWPGRPKTVTAAAAGVVVAVGLVYVLGLEGWLAVTQSQAMWVRFIVAAVTIAPLAAAMGHMFPTGLRMVGRASGALVPWAWGVNGFASVAATVATPLIAMNIGFMRLTLTAVGCYALAGALSLALPQGRRR